MPGTDLFGQTLPCTCGRTHRIEPDVVAYDSDVLHRLPATCERIAPDKRIVIVMDARTRDAAGREALDRLLQSGWDAEAVCVPDPAPGASPVCDDTTKQALAATIPPCPLLLAVGSGVISDLTKWIAYDRGVPYIALATAASMNGYASANVAPTIGGVKSLIRARPPRAVLGTPAILSRAPYRLTAAGLGDILAKSVSSTDWCLNHELFGDYYCQRAVDLIADIEPLYMDNPTALLSGEDEPMAALFRGLLLTGVAMTMAETSAPASGGEHLISHTLDMMSAVDGTPHDLHGRQVGLGTVIASELYRRVLALDTPTWRLPPETTDAAFWGPLADAVAQPYKEKQAKLRAAKDRLSDAGRWQALRATLDGMLRTPVRIRDCLTAAQAAVRPADIGIDETRLVQALLHGHEIRSRFTILDLAWLAGVLPDQAEDVVRTCAG